MKTNPIILAVCVVSSLMVAFGAAVAGPAPSAQSIPAVELVRPDGTLDLHANRVGRVDTRGWNVQLDPARGPVFAAAAPAATSWSALGSGVNGQVLAVALSGSVVYAGGDFTTICANTACSSGVLTVNHVARWDGSAWSGLGNGVDGSVYALAIGANHVYVGGTFTHVCGNSACNSGNVIANRTAHWNGSGWLPMGNGLEQIVETLAISGTNVIAGGQFYWLCDDPACNVGNTRVAYIALWNGSAWSGFGYGFTQDVHSIVVSGADVYVGGNFVRVCLDALCSSSAYVNRIAHWNGGAWSGLGNGLNAFVETVAVSGTDVYAGGGFSQLCGDVTCSSWTTRMNTVAHWNGSAWSAMDNGLGESASGVVYALAVDGSAVDAGGAFQHICTNVSCTVGTSANNIAHWDGSSWSPLAFGLGYKLGNSVPGTVWGLAARGGTLYAGGYLPYACGDAACASGNLTVNNIARWFGLSLNQKVFLPAVER